MSFEEEMSRFEAEVRRTQQSVAAAALGGFRGGGGFVPSQVRFNVHPPPPQMLMSNPPPNPVMTSAPAVISAPAASSSSGAAAAGGGGGDDDEEEDVFAKLAMYEADHKKEKKAKKKEKKEKKAAKAAGTSTSALAAAAPPAAAAAAPPAALPPQPPQHSFTPVSVVTKNTPVSATIGDDALKKAKRQKRVIRTGGGQIWEDDSLKEWDPNDFRLFCGDLGNDVTDEVLARTFGRYPSFTRAKVIRDKRTNKTKGYGFVSFQDPADFTKAVREMNGKYVGSRPIKLRKSNWKDRNIDVVRKKQKEKQQMGYKW